MNTPFRLSDLRFFWKSLSTVTDNLFVHFDNPERSFSSIRDKEVFFEAKECYFSENVMTVYDLMPFLQKCIRNHSTGPYKTQRMYIRVRWDENVLFNTASPIESDQLVYLDLMTIHLICDAALRNLFHPLEWLHSYLKGYLVIPELVIDVRGMYFMLVLTAFDRINLESYRDTFTSVRLLVAYENWIPNWRDRNLNEPLVERFFSKTLQIQQNGYFKVRVSYQKNQSELPMQETVNLIKHEYVEVGDPMDPMKLLNPKIWHNQTSRKLERRIRT